MNVKNGMIFLPKTTIMTAAIAVFMSFSLFPADMKAMLPLTMPSAASNGMGGHHPAYTDNVYSLFVNPAAMMRVQQASLFSIAPSLYSPKFVYNMRRSSGIFSEDPAAVQNTLDILAKTDGQLALGVELREIPLLHFALVNNGFGFGIWNRTFINANITGEANSVEASAYADIMAPIGFAFRILSSPGHYIDGGFTVKPFARAMAKLDPQNIFDFQNDLEEKIKNADIPVITGGSLSAGLMYRWDAGLRAGLVFNNIFSSGKTAYNFQGGDNSLYYVPFTMDASIAYDLNFNRALGFVFAASWQDLGNIFNQNDYLNRRNAVLDLGLGLQISVFNTLIIRAGMKEMLPAAGLGLYLGALQVDLACYGKEFGSEPGQFPAAVAEFSVSIRPELKRSEERSWTRRAVIQVPEKSETETNLE